jgi:uncharacterized membrane protein
VNGRQAQNDVSLSNFLISKYECSIENYDINLQPIRENCKGHLYCIHTHHPLTACLTTTSSLYLPNAFIPKAHFPISYNTFQYKNRTLSSSKFLKLQSKQLKSTLKTTSSTLVIDILIHITNLHKNMLSLLLRFHNNSSAYIKLQRPNYLVHLTQFAHKATSLKCY